MEENTYVVSARKYRPRTFESVVGQPSLTSTLRNAISTGRLAQAYLFCGPRGVGKTSCARIFARSINCEHPTATGEACGECDSCRAIDEGNSFNIIELDAASNNSVDDIRNLTEQVNVPPQQGKYRVFIIDEVHMLSSQAFNAFLKTLEEPPKYVIFILATTEKHKVIPTILSRCQIYDFKRITVGDIAEHLGRVAAREGITAEESALNVIARKADGAMRDALSIFDQVAASSPGGITYDTAIRSLNVLDYDYYFRLIEHFRNHDVQQALLIYKEILDKGFDSQFFINGLAGHIRDLMVAYTPETAPLLEVGGELARQYTEQARSLPIEWYYLALDLLNSCDLNYRTVSDKRLHVELCLIKLSRLGKGNTIPSGEEPPGGKQPVATPKPDAGTPKQPAPPTTSSTTSQPAAPVQPTNNPANVRPVRSTVRIGGGPAAPTDRQATPPLPATPPPPADAPKPAAPATAAAAKQPAAEPAKTDAEGAAKPADVLKAWEEFVHAHPDRHLLVSAMRSSSPEQTGATSYRVSVDHPGQVQVLTENLGEVMSYLRTATGCEALTMTVEKSESGPRTRTINEREALRNVTDRNKVINTLLESLNVDVV